MRNRTVLIGFLVLTALSLPGISHGGTCKSERYHVSGAVKDASGRPAKGARIWVLMDKASKKQFAKNGIRAKSFTTDDQGQYDAVIVCGSQPDPCARNPRHLTLAVTDRLNRTKMKIFRLEDLVVSKRAGECLVKAPDIVF